MLTTKEKREGQITFVNLKSPKGESPYFCTQKKVDDKWVEDEKGNNIKGVLVAVGHDTYDWEGQKKDKFKLEFQSEEGLFVVEANMTMMTRGIINSLATADLNGISDIEINVYENKKGYPAAYITEGGERLEWKYGNNEGQEPYPGVTETPLPDGTVHKSYKAMNDFFIKVLLEEVGGKLPEKESSEDTPVDPASNQAMDAVPADDDLPF